MNANNEEESIDSDAESQYPSDKCENDEDSEDSESSSDQDEQLALNNVFDKEFFKCYSALKRKDPRIYDKNYRFFSNDSQHVKSKLRNQPSLSHDSPIEKSEINKDKNRSKMSLLEYQIKTAQDETDDTDLLSRSGPSLLPSTKSKYEQELEEIKAELLIVANQISDSDDSGFELLKVKKKKSYSRNAANIDDDTMNLIDGENDQDLEYLRDLWSRERLDEREQFMRDYITKKIYIPSEQDKIVANVPNEEITNVSEVGHKETERKPREFKSAEELEKEELEKLNPAENLKIKIEKIKHHTDEADFHEQVARIPRNATDTIRDMQRVTSRKERRRKRRERKRQEKAQLIGQLRAAINREEGDNLENETILSKREMKKKKIKEPAPFEDIVGGSLPTKFKYRETIANDFGLTNQELLFATDEELNKWSCLNKIVAYRANDQEIYDIKAFKNKAKNLALKKKIFKSLYGSSSEDENEDESKKRNNKTDDEGESCLDTKKRKNKTDHVTFGNDNRKKRKNKNQDDGQGSDQDIKDHEDDEIVGDEQQQDSISINQENTQYTKDSESYNVDVEHGENTDDDSNHKQEKSEKVSKSKSKKYDKSNVNESDNETGKKLKKKKKKRGLNHKRTKCGLSEERLLAYGLSKKRLRKSKLL